MDKYKSFAITSIPNLLFTSVEVVITGVASIKSAILYVSLFAPPKWPDKVEMTKLPLSSMFKTAGSVTLDSIRGAMDLIRIP